jgi:DNA-binding NarL/FixJ family response regulator
MSSRAAEAFTDGPNGEIAVFDPTGDFYLRISQLDFGARVWRTGAVVSGVPAAALLLVACNEAPPWDQIREWSRLCLTVVATNRVRDEDELHALELGAIGYFDAAMSRDGLRHLLAGAIRGEAAFRRRAIGSWLESARPSRLRTDRRRRDVLTRRQREIVGLIASGATDKRIASVLGIRTSTAQKHVANVLRRLGVANRAAAVGLYIRATERPPRAKASGTAPS